MINHFSKKNIISYLKNDFIEMYFTMLLNYVINNRINYAKFL